ncbi:MAG: hypothetical protein WCT19_01625 [Candidatus Paceibacterota bacterium]
MKKNVIGLPRNRFKKGGPPRQTSYKKCDGEQPDISVSESIEPAIVPMDGGGFCAETEGERAKTESAQPLNLDDVIPAGAFPLSAKEQDEHGTDGPDSADPN